jgi:hypothetical protein
MERSLSDSAICHSLTADRVMISGWLTIRNSGALLLNYAK